MFAFSNGGGNWLKMSCGSGLKFDRLSQTCGTGSYVGGESSSYGNSIDFGGTSSQQIVTSPHIEGKNADVYEQLARI